MEKEIKKACEILWRWYKKDELKKILVDYKCSVHWFFGAKKKMENPVHYRTGKPLKESTLYSLKCDYNRGRISCAAEKLLIRLFVLDGVFGRPGPVLKQKLESYFNELDEKTKYNRWNLSWLKKAFNELRAQNPGPSYETREERLKKWEEEIIRHYKIICSRLEEEREELKQRVALLQSTVPEKKQIRNKRKNDLGLHIVDGGKKLKPDNGPFTPVNPSWAADKDFSG
jgi:hypothetical protein